MWEWPNTEWHIPRSRWERDKEPCDDSLLYIVQRLASATFQISCSGLVILFQFHFFGLTVSPTDQCLPFSMLLIRLPWRLEGNPFRDLLFCLIYFLFIVFINRPVSEFMRSGLDLHSTHTHTHTQHCDVFQTWLHTTVTVYPRDSMLNLGRALEQRSRTSKSSSAQENAQYATPEEAGTNTNKTLKKTSSGGTHTFIPLTFNTVYIMPHRRSVLQLKKMYLVCEAEVTAARLQQQTNDVCVSVFAGAHEGRGALAVLCIYIGAAAQEQLHHGNTSVAHRKHERRLARLERGWELQRIRIKQWEGRCEMEIERCKVGEGGAGGGRKGWSGVWGL